LPHRLELGVTVTLKTLDGAIDARAEGEAAIWGHRFDEVIGEGTADAFHAHARADLGEVVGTLRLFPDASRPHVGVLALQLDFLEDETRGYLWPWIVYGSDVSEDEIWLSADRYQALEGTFGNAE